MPKNKIEHMCQKRKDLKASIGWIKPSYNFGGEEGGYSSMLPWISFLVVYGVSSYEINSCYSSN